MKKKMIVLGLVGILTFSCGSSKPSWERKEKPQVTQNDHAVLGGRFAALIVCSWHTFTKK